MQSSTNRFSTRLGALTDKDVRSTLIVALYGQVDSPLGEDQSAQISEYRQKEKQHWNEFGEDAHIMTKKPETWLSHVCKCIENTLGSDDASLEKLEEIVEQPRKQKIARIDKPISKQLRDHIKTNSQIQKFK